MRAIRGEFAHSVRTGGCGAGVVQRAGERLFVCPVLKRHHRPQRRPALRTPLWVGAKDVTQQHLPPNPGPSSSRDGRWRRSRYNVPTQRRCGRLIYAIDRVPQGVWLRLGINLIKSSHAPA